MTRKLWLCWLWVLVLSVGCGAAPKAKVEPPPPPVPPTEPLAWMPADAAVLGHANVSAFRDTPLWELWNEFQQSGQSQLLIWVDVNLVDEVTFSGTNLESPQPSFVGVVKGRFGEGYLAGLGTRDQVAPQARGLLHVFVRPEATWAQLGPDLLLVCSPDRTDWLVARAGQGPGQPIKDAAMFRSLSERLAFDRSHVSVLVDDPEGKGRARLEQGTERFGVAIPDDISRAGLSLTMGPQVNLTAMAEAATAEGATSLRNTADQILSSLASNMFVAMFGLRPFVSAFKAESQGAYVTVRGDVNQADLFAMLGKVRSVLGIAGGRRASGSTP